MKKILWAVLLVAFSFVSRPAWAADMKIGYVDLAKVFDQYEKTRTSDRQVESQAKAKQGDREKLTGEIRRLRDELELLSESGRQAKQQEIDDKVKSLKDYDRDAVKALRQTRDELVKDILNDINGSIAEIGQKQSFHLILNDRVVLFSPKQNDITADVIQALNARYTAAEPKKKA